MCVILANYKTQIQLYYLILNSKKLIQGKNNIIIIIIKKQDSNRSGTSAQGYRRLEPGVQYSHASKFLLSYCGPPRWHFKEKGCIMV